MPDTTSLCGLIAYSDSESIPTASGTAETEVADRLFAELQDPSRRWVREVKIIGSGRNAREVVVERFNAAEIEQLRRVLADLAKETGGRKDIQVLTGDADSPLEVRHGYDPKLSRLTDDELDQMERLVEKIGTDGRV